MATHAAVHVVASRRTADETALDPAASECADVPSNGRFGDFRDKPAVKGAGSFGARA